MPQRRLSDVKVHQYDSHCLYRAFTHQISRRRKKNLANHRSCHHVPSHSFLQAGRHFISWLYSFWLGSSPHSSVIAMLKMAHPSRWGLARAINRRAPQRRICLWAGTAQNRLFANVVFSASPSHSKVRTGKLQIFFWCRKRVVQHASEKKARIIIFCFMNPRNNLNIYLNELTNLGSNIKPTSRRNLAIALSVCQCPAKLVNLCIYMTLNYRH